jgi:hypothetical protein
MKPHAAPPTFSHEGMEYQSVREPTKNDYVKEIEKPTCGGKMNDKKEILLEISKQKIDIAAALGIHSKQLQESFEQVCPPHGDINKRSFKASDAAEAIYELKLILEGYENSDHRHLRNNVVIRSLAPVKEIVEAAAQLVQLTINKDCKSVLVKLDRPALGRRFLANGSLPDDDALRTCLFCHHATVDAPHSNAVAKAMNENCLHEYTRKSKAHKLLKDAGKTLARAPPVPKYEPMYYQCHCRQMTCLRGGSGSCVKCKNEGTKIDDSGFCPCEICQCTCSLAYNVRDFLIVSFPLF